MIRCAVVCVLLALLAPTAGAGVVVTMDVRLPDAAEPAGSETFYAEGERVRMDPFAGKGEPDMSAIFRDDAMYFLDHDRKVARKIDEKSLEQLSAQLAEMMKQLERMPAQQRTMMEKMLKGKLPAGMGTPTPRRVETGGTEQVGDYPCTVYTMYTGDDPSWEVCAADESVAEPMSEAMGAFRAMSRFAESLQQVLGSLPLARLVDSPQAAISEIDGFPVRVRMFDGAGAVVREMTLRSLERQDVADATFEIPQGYEVQDLQDEMPR